MSLPTATPLPAGEWRNRAISHRDRVLPWITPRLERRQKGQRHPVDDFLFDYYQYRPGQLALWHPGLGYSLSEPTWNYVDHADYLVQEEVAQVNPIRFQRRRRKVTRALTILESTSQRPKHFGCFGMHEWAMVYGLGQQQVRHEQLPLRLPPAQVAEAVDSIGLRCTHFDAYRFFTPEAATKQIPLTRDSQVEFEQPACLHAGMDLYRFAYEAGPFIPSELTADCFEHARAARELDMQASPYDVSSFGLQTIPVETPAGRAEYAVEQKRMADSASTLRIRVISALRKLLHAIPTPESQAEAPSAQTAP